MRERGGGGKVGREGREGGREGGRERRRGVIAWRITNTHTEPQITWCHQRETVVIK